MFKGTNLKDLTKKFGGKEKQIYLAHQADIDKMCEDWEKYYQECNAKGINLADEGKNIPKTFDECFVFYIDSYLEDEYLEARASQYYAEFI